MSKPKNVLPGVGKPIFKGMPDQYVVSFLSGRILFRTLSYFMRLADDGRGDSHEGRHVDAPNHNVVLRNLSTGQSFSGAFEFHNMAAMPNRIYCFCTTLNKNKAAEFGGSTAEIHNPAAFKKLVYKALTKHNRSEKLEKPLLISKQITYYNPAEMAPENLNIKDARDLLFAKRECYKDQSEYRFVFAREGSNKLVQKITNKTYSPLDDIVGVDDDEVFLDIGKIEHIARKI